MVGALLLGASCGRDVFVGRDLSTGGLPGGIPTGGRSPASPAGTPGVFEGTWRTSELGSAGLADFTAITGDLVVEGATDESLVLFNLASIGGDLVVCESEALTLINLGSLVEVGGDVVLCGLEAQLAITMPALLAVGGELALEGLPGLTLVNLGALAVVDGSVVAQDVGATTFALPALTAVGGDVVLGGVGDTSQVTTVRLEALDQVGRDLEVIGLPALTTLRLDGLRRVGGDMVVADNPVLVEIALGPASDVEGGCLCRNASLADCALNAALLAAGVEVTGNLEDDVCP